MNDPEPIHVNINVQAGDAKRLIEALEHVTSCQFSESAPNAACSLLEYQRRIFNAFVRYCPDRVYTATFLDVDTLINVVDARIPKLGSHQLDALREVAMRWFKAYGDPKGGPGTRWHATRDYRHDDQLYDFLASLPGFAEAHHEMIRQRELGRAKGSPE